MEGKIAVEGVSAMNGDTQWRGEHNGAEVQSKGEAH